MVDVFDSTLNERVPIYIFSSSRLLDWKEDFSQDPGESVDIYTFPFFDHVNKVLSRAIMFLNLR